MVLSQYIALIASIFFDTSSDQKRSIDDIYHPKDLTKHYLSEYAWFSLDGVYVAAHYRDIAESVEAYKYRSDRQHGDIYVDLLARVVEQYWILSYDDIAFMSVPMHWNRYFIRGFDHMDLIVSRLTRQLAIKKIQPIKAHWTRRQSKLTKVNRMKNREDAFVLKSGKILPKTVILIDDIISTGSTLHTCAKILKSAGVEQVYWVCIASNQ